MSTRSTTSGIDEHYLASKAHCNLSTPVLVEHALRRDEGRLSASGCFVATTERTGRSPDDKFIVRSTPSEELINWGKVNVPIEREQFDRLRGALIEYLQDREIFLLDCFAGADPDYRVPVRVITEYAWHCLFARTLLVRPTAEELKQHAPEYTVLSAPDFKADPSVHGTKSDAFVILDLEQRVVIIGGTEYAGEIKKSVFTLLNHILPQQRVFPMHCSANVGASGDTALFFGLSGTGKTTLSADPKRRLIGDDEHGWGPQGVFNFEGGCYAKCINLSKENEPQIYNALRFGAVLENVVLDEHAREANFDDDTLTENTRAAYPLEYIDNIVTPSVGDHPRNVVFLTCDAFGVLPPISRLTEPQAMYHFLSGYTAKVAGTEAGVDEPQATFSTLFGAPFFTQPPMTYAEMLGERLIKHDAQCWLVNTGWSGGPYGVGKRMKIPYTRAMINAALDGKLQDAPCEADPVFGLHIPKSCPDVPSEVLVPWRTWKDKSAFDAKAKDLADRFKKNFQRFEGVTKEVAAAGPS